MQIYKCQFLGLIDAMGRAVTSFPVPHGIRARVRMREDHHLFGAPCGGITVTSAVKLIDFECGIIVTQNSVYNFNIPTLEDAVIPEMSEFVRKFLR